MSSISCPRELLSPTREGALKPQFIASWSEHRPDLRQHLVAKWELSCGTEPLTCGEWECLRR